MHTYTQEELQQKFWDDAGEVFGYDIIGSDTHPMKKAFELFCVMAKEQGYYDDDDDDDDDVVVVDDDDDDDDDDDYEDAEDKPEPEQVEKPWNKYTSWNILMNDIRTFKRNIYECRDGCLMKNKGGGHWIGTKLIDCSHGWWEFGGSSIPQEFRDNYLVKAMFHKKYYTQLDKKAYLKMNKIKGYSRFHNHREINKLMMSF